MTALDANLLPDEKIIFRTKKHYIIFLTPAMLTLMTLIFLMNSNPFVVKAAILPGVSSLVAWAHEALDYMTSEFAITNKRIMMREGFFFRHTNDARLTTITNIGCVQSLVGQALNYGTVVLNTFGGMNDAFPEIPSPREFQMKVQAELDKLTRNT